MTHLLETWRQGVEEFNAGRYWEAHEKWERGWKALAEPERSWVQAWIQLAGVLHLRQKGRETAARALSQSALFKLERSQAMAVVLPRLEVEGGVDFLKLNLVRSLTEEGATETFENARKALKAKLLSGTGL